MTLVDRSFVADAACKGQDTELWFRPAGNSPAKGDDLLAYARSVCAGCPVRQPCADYALAVAATGQRLDGMFGGMDEHERHAALRGFRERRAS